MSVHDKQRIPIVYDNLGIPQRCPFGKIMNVSSPACEECENFLEMTDKYVECNCQFKLDQMPIRWHRARAGRAFGKEAIVIYDGDPDPRLVKCAIYDCKYILVEDLKKLPADETE